MRFAIIMINVLLLFGANACAKNSQEEIARVFNDPDVAELVWAALSGDEIRLQELVSAGVDPDSKGIENITPLYWMMASNSYPDKNGFEALVALGADPLVPHSVSGRTAYLLTARHRDSFYLGVIINSGVDIDHYHESEGSIPTALYQTIFLRRDAHMEMLIDAGADIELQNSVGNTPLLIAGAIGNWKAAYKLLESGADFTAETPQGNTIVYWLENSNYSYIPIPGTTDWRKKVIDFLKDAGVEIAL